MSIENDSGRDCGLNRRRMYLNEDITAKLLKDAEERANAGAQVEIRQYVAA